MRCPTNFWSFTDEEKANLVKKIIFLSLFLTRFSHVIGESSSSLSPVSFRDIRENPLEQSTKTNQLHNHHHHHHRLNNLHYNNPHQHHHHHRHRHRHHHGSFKSTINQQQNFQLINADIDTRSSNNNKLIKSDGDKPCATCASLDEKLFVKLKLEAVKNQILSKLHLDTKPNVTSQLPDSMVIDALLESNSIQLKKGDLSLSLIPSSSPSSHQSSILSSLSSTSSLYSSTVSKSHGGFNQPQQSSQSHLDKSKSNNYSNNQPEKLNESTESADNYYGITSEIISFPEPGIQINGHTLLDFTLPNTNIDLLDVALAKLWVKFEQWDSSLVPKKSLESQKISLFIFADRNITKNQNKGINNNNIEATNGSLTSINGVYLEKILMKKIPASIGWKQIDITNEVARWFPSRKKLSLMIDCSGCERKIKFRLFDQQSNNTTKTDSKSKQNQQSSNRIESNGWKDRSATITTTTTTKQGLSPSNGSHHRPYLIINTRPKNLKRAKRDFPPTCDPNFKHCCVQPLYVNFTNLGWDSWIIAPRGYHAGYCAGDCLKPMKTPEIFSWYHSYVMDSYRIANPYASISPCCTPTRLEPLVILYWQGHNVVASKLPNMIVKECGCS